jgi:hypothetical protein
MQLKDMVAKAEYALPRTELVAKLRGLISSAPAPASATAATGAEGAS